MAGPRSKCCRIINVAIPTVSKSVRHPEPVVSHMAQELADLFVGRLLGTLCTLRGNPLAVAHLSIQGRHLARPQPEDNLTLEQWTIRGLNAKPSCC